MRCVLKSTVVVRRARRSVPWGHRGCEFVRRSPNPPALGGIPVRAISVRTLVRAVRAVEGMRTFMRPRNALLTLVVALGMSGIAATAEAKGTFFLLELNTGLAESAYSGGSARLGYGASGGITLRIPATPLRYHLLGSVMHRASSRTGNHQGAQFVAERGDLDLFSAHRIVLPVWRMIRIYGELGLGIRLSSTELQRSDGFGSLRQYGQRFLVLGAVGVQARVSKHLSLGIRGELTPMGSGPDLSTYAADLSATRNRVAAFVQIAVHL